MDLLTQVAEGFQTIDADLALKQRAHGYVRQWLTGAEFADYRPQLEWLIQGQQWAGLLDRFCEILPFGTGGRRGPVGIGPNRMNRWTLEASVQGHCEYLKERFPGFKPLRVVLAYDVRRFEDQRGNYNPRLANPVMHLSSKDLAHYAARVYAANGVQAYILPETSPRYLATPELSFTIRFLSAHGGLNISASHNPPDDNGGKFYDERGGQPVPPDDQIMADLVDQVIGIKSMDWIDAVRAGQVLCLDETPHQAYIDLCRKQSLIAPPRANEIEIVFTPLHGVGSMTAMEVLIQHGFLVTPVQEQMAPDGMFPNVTLSPNPEVPQSMDRAMALAQQRNADLVLATDPDADRVGMMIPWKCGQGSVVSGQHPESSALTTDHSPLATAAWRFVNGNELAALLTHFKLSKLAQAGRLPQAPIVITTEVTTSLITRIARHFRAQVVDNLLVGFKYMADVLWQLEQNGAYEDVRGSPQDLVIATEESHGILVTPHIRDKDAAGAALLMAEMVLDQKRQHRTCLDYLDSIFRQFGYFRNEMIPVVMAGIQGRQEMARMLELLRRTPPVVIGGLTMTETEDLRDENGRMGPFKGGTDFAARNFLIFRLGDTGRVVLRPSGTEPKAKAYVEVSSAPCPAGTPAAAWQRTCQEVDERTRIVAEDFLHQALRLVGLQPPAGGVRMSR